MNHDDARRLLLGLSDKPTTQDRNRAIEIVMRHRAEPEPMREVRVPFPGGREVVLRTPTGRFTSEDWGYMLRVFEVIRIGLLTDRDAEAPVDLDER